MGCLSVVRAALKGDLRRTPRQETTDSLTRSEKQEKIDPNPPESPSDEPADHQFLRRRTTTTSTSSFTPVSERNRRLTNESLSSIGKTKRRNTDDSISSQIVRLRNYAARRRTSDSEEMVGPKKKRARSLRDEIQAAMVLRNKSELRFVPLGALKQLFHHEVVARILERERARDRLSPDADIQSLKTFVCTKAIKVFAILAWAESEHLIEQFYEHQFIDEHLPVSVELNEDEDRFEADSYLFGRLSINEHPFNNDEWNSMTVDDFCNYYQWSFVIPVFDQRQFRYKFHECTRMPFVDERSRSRKESYHSVVEEWRIHRDHIHMPELIRIPESLDQHPTVAVKKLKRMSLTDEEFEIVAKEEVDALEIIGKLNHRHLIRTVAYYAKGNDHCIIFPWARRGNLRDVWKTEPPTLTPRFLEWTFTQLCGLAEAVKKLHRSNKEKGIRHGDMKPENILCFDDSQLSETRGLHDCVLVITDVGLSRSHEALTEDRKGATRTKSGTIMYEPPETELQAENPRTRRYDVWSLGCIYFEFVVWLLYGPKELVHFREDLSSLGENTRFYTIQRTSESRSTTACLNDVVQKWVDWIKKDARCQEPTAVRSLVELVVDRLLIVDVGPPRGLQVHRAPTLHETNALISAAGDSVPLLNVRAPTFDSAMNKSMQNQSRATAEEMDLEMKRILRNATSSTGVRLEWINWDAPAQHGPRQYGNRLVASDATNKRNQQNEYGSTPLNDNWKYAPDADVARYLSTNSNLWSSIAPDQNMSRLCERCSTLPLWLPRHNFSDTLAGLRERSNGCDLCGLLKKHVEGHTDSDHDVIQFFRVGSSLTSHDHQRMPILSLYMLPNHDTLDCDGPSEHLQFGLPQLYAPGSSEHLQILSSWVRTCDSDHHCPPKDKTFLPTRVIELDKDPSTVRLFCGMRGQTSPGRYLALSHRWGSSAQHQDFCTYRHNVDQHQTSMTVTKFPKTFQDALQITRALGIQYLWIDSLCIIQDDKEDWKTESRLMEQVFSNAYITIAASCATGNHDGFLKPRPSRDFVVMKKDDGSNFYICDAIDDFTQDVEEGQLNRRGWVLQERALSRRTIYFTEKQTYWECGQGVRCETLTKMNNKKASFLGDASFPDSIESYVKGTRIQLFQSLYERYATLDLSYPADRPVAIKGLEKRLIRTLKTEGGYGVFEVYLHRCLLWQRSGSSLKRIETFRGEAPPSWSWMAYEGGIKYMAIPFGGVVWAQDLHSPWSRHRSSSALQDEDGREYQTQNTIEAQAWGLTSLDGSDDLILDDPSRSFTQSFKYVIVGTEKSNAPAHTDRKVYVLVVAAILGVKDVYERVGVGILRESLIRRSKIPMPIRLV